MPTKIGPNRGYMNSGIFAMIVVPIVFSFFFYYQLHKFLWEVRYVGFRWDKLALLTLSVLGLLFAIKLFRAFLKTPFWAIIDDGDKTLELKYLFGKSTLIQRDHMMAYNDATVTVAARSNTSRYPGFVLQLLDGTKIVVGEQGLNDIYYITSMLDYWGLKKIDGEEQFNG